MSAPFIWAGAGLLYATAIFVYWGDVLNPDTYFYVIFWRELVTEHTFHTFVVTTPKLLMSALYGPVYLATQNTLGIIVLTSVSIAVILLILLTWVSRVRGGLAAGVACAFVLLSPDVHVNTLGANSVLLAGLLLILAVQALRETSSDFLPPLLVVVLFLLGLARADFWFLYPIWLGVHLWKNRRPTLLVLGTGLLWVSTIGLNSWFSNQLFSDPIFLARTVGIGNESASPFLSLDLSHLAGEMLRFGWVWGSGWARTTSVLGVLFGLIGLRWLFRHYPKQALFLSTVLLSTIVSDFVLFIGRADPLAGRFLLPQAFLMFGAAGIGVQESIAWLLRLEPRGRAWLTFLYSRGHPPLWLAVTFVVLIGLSWVTYTRSLVVLVKSDQQDRVELRQMLNIIQQDRGHEEHGRLLVPQQQMAETILRLRQDPSDVEPWVYVQWSGLTIEDLSGYRYVLYDPRLADPGSPSFYLLGEGQPVSTPSFSLMPLYVGPSGQSFLYHVTTQP